MNMIDMIIIMIRSIIIIVAVSLSLSLVILSWASAGLRRRRGLQHAAHLVPALPLQEARRHQRYPGVPVHAPGLARSGYNVVCVLVLCLCNFVLMLCLVWLLCLCWFACWLCSLRCMPQASRGPALCAQPPYWDDYVCLLFGIGACKYQAFVMHHTAL